MAGNSLSWIPEASLEFSLSGTSTSPFRDWQVIHFRELVTSPSSTFLKGCHASKLDDVYDGPWDQVVRHRHLFARLAGIPLFHAQQPHVGVTVWNWIQGIVLWRPYTNDHTNSQQLRDKRECCAGLRPSGPRCRTWLADNLHFGSVNTDALLLWGSIQGVHYCMCDWARSQAGAMAATHRPTAAWDEHSHWVSWRWKYVLCLVWRNGAVHARFYWSSVACAYWLHECHVRRLFYDEWDATPNESFSACDWCGALCWFLRFGHCCLRQARVSDDTCKERRPRHEHVCGSIEVPFCIVLVRWSGQVNAVALLLSV